MTPSADQIAAFQANGGFAPSAVSVMVLGFVFAVLLLWGVWAMRTAYVGWAENRINQRQFLGVCIRFVAMYLALTMLKMALVTCIPLVLLIGTYDLKTVVTVSCVQFALFFVDFWFQIARWIDSTILDALHGWGFGANRPHTNFDPLIGLNNTFGDMLLNFVMAMMFIVLPTFWVMALAWAGVRAGNILGALTVATGDAKAAGGSGSRLAMTAASKGGAK